LSALGWFGTAGPARYFKATQINQLNLDAAVNFFGGVKGRLDCRGCSLALSRTTGNA